jgi:hypothetical protein
VRAYGSVRSGVRPRRPQERIASRNFYDVATNLAPSEVVKVACERRRPRLAFLHEALSVEMSVQRRADTDLLAALSHTSDFPGCYCPDAAMSSLGERAEAERAASIA